MFIQTWNNYLPVIRIFLKRSANGEQTLDMNKTDFMRAAGGRKIKYNFSVTLTKGRVYTGENPAVLVKDLIAVLQQDDVTNKFIRQSIIEFNMNSNCQLTIKNITPAPEETIAEEIKTDDTEAAG